MAQLVFVLDTLSGILGLALKRQGLGSVEVDLGVDPCALLRLGALCELLGDSRCFCYTTITMMSGILLESRNA